ncbi:hypothetical protein PPYR_02637 [Photinus pyralis]|uniref:Pacifastin domain-containing protein n=1 Tax=Photinus pyralis TaxID=7054 RepID=A0A5N4B7T1_PHOPY|nr:hypothetical protein PPYR_02637 [Photinus pyralis]
MATHRVYVFNFVILLVTVLVFETFADSFVCDSNKRYQENKCNNCSCTVDQNQEVGFGCTKMFCDNEESAKLKSCDPAIPSPYKNCWCFRQWGTICEIPK